MEKQKFILSREWDYSYGMSRVPENSVYSQKDWNQTLITSINMISAMISKISLVGGTNTICVHPKIMSLIEDLEYYDKSTGYLAGRYKVVVKDDNEENTVLVYRDEFIGNITIKNYFNNNRDVSPRTDTA